MDSTILYRPTMEEQRFFDEVRRHIDQNRNDFRKAGQWLETEYAIEQVDRREREGRPGDPANYQQAQEEREQRSREAGNRPKERSPESVLFARLIRCAQDFLHDQPDVTNYQRHERLPLARRIIFVTWLMTDPDAAELKLGFTTLEMMPWAGDWRVGLGRSMVRDDIIPRGWIELAHPAWHELGEGSEAEPKSAMIDGPAPPNLLIWQGVRHELPPRLWRLLKFMWNRDKATLHELESEVWDREVVRSSTVNSTVSRLNAKLLTIGCPVTLSVKSGYVTRT